mgnify:CR=1 FL=1|tara:strand:+ start:1186 stop:2616 length:1431 start_codon:yes stop_codon:yes gene_type:complete
MLSKLRHFSKSKFAGILVGIIIIPFVFWGMGGVFTTGNKNNVAKINDHSISTQDFYNYLNNSQLDTEYVKQNIENNILEKLLAELISKNLLLMEIKDLKISVSEKTLVEKIKKNKNFLDDQNKFSRLKYEKFLLLNNMIATNYEKKIKDEELINKLFLYINGGVKSPFFMTNNIFKEQTKKIDIKYINLENAYKKKEDFTIKELETYINNNKDELYEDIIDFSYLKITPKNLIGSDEYNQAFFEKIDQIENDLLNGLEFNALAKKIKMLPTTKKNYILNNPSNDIEKKIYEKRNESKTGLIEENDFYILYKINNIKKILPSLNNQEFTSKITRILYVKSKYDYNNKLLIKISNKNFGETDFTNLSSNFSTEIEQIQLDSIRDNNKFDMNSIKLLYSMPINSYVLISDNKKKIYVAKIIKFYEDNISENSDKFSNYVNQSNIKMKDYMHTSYDYLINDKYKIKINQKTLERIKNYFR